MFYQSEEFLFFYTWNFYNKPVTGSDEKRTNRRRYYYSISFVVLICNYYHFIFEVISHDNILIGSFVYTLPVTRG